MTATWVVERQVTAECARYERESRMQSAQVSADWARWERQERERIAAETEQAWAWYAAQAEVGR
jgi:hypothetical protein